MNKLLSVLALLSIMFFCSCADNDENETELIPSTPIELLADEYSLFSSDIKMDGFAYGIDTTRIFFNGRKDKKLWIGCYDRITKEEIFNWEETTILDTMPSVDEGYGNTQQHYIDEFRLKSPYKKGDEYGFILWGFSNSEQRIITSDLYFVSNKKSKKEKSYTYPSDNYFFRWLNPWYKNSIIVELASDLSPRKSAVYSLNGEKLFDSQTQLVYRSSNSEYIFPINIEEYIDFTETFTRKNAKSNSNIWISEKPLKDLPENTRLDNVEISQEDNEFLKFSIDYTLYNGEKNQRKGKLNIETGIISY